MIDVTRTGKAFSIPGEPQGKGRPRVVRNGGFTRTYTPEKTASYENLIKVEYQAQCDNAHFGDDTCVCMRITAYYGIPKSASKRKRQEMIVGTVKPTKKPDADNVVKVICDALNGIAYRDDTQVTYLEFTKRYAEVPRVEVHIWEA